MNEMLLLMLHLMGSGFAGAILGLVFFWGLWTTIRHLTDARRPAIWMLVSLILRFGFILTGFFLLARYGGWEHTLAALVGFTIARLLMSHRLQPSRIKKELDA